MKIIKTAMSADKRKFVMEEDYSKDLKWALGLNQFGAEVLGVWPNEEHVESEPWHVKLRVPFMIVLLFFGIFLPQTWALILVIDNLSLVVDNLLTNAAAVASCIKLFFLWRNKHTMLKVVELTRLDWLRSKSFSERDLMLSNASGMRLLTVADYSVMLLSALGFMALPLFRIDTRLINNITDYGNRHLPLQSYYPYDYSKSPYFELTQALHYAGCIFVSFAITIPESYFAALVIHVSGQIQILGIKLEHLFREESSLSASLADLIQRHAHLMEMAKILDASFTHVVFGQVFMCMVILCSYGFQVLAIMDASNQDVSILQIITLLCTMANGMLHTFVDCFVGERLAQQSADLLNSIYKCRWYAIDGRRARDLLPMMILSAMQKPLTAGKIFPLSLATYCKILKTAVSYISVLIAVNAE